MNGMFLLRHHISLESLLSSMPMMVKSIAQTMAMFKKDLTLFMVELFCHMGLHMKSTKTKAIIMFGSSCTQRISSQEYARCIDKSLMTQRECSLQKVICPECTNLMNCQYLTLHMHEKYGHAMSQVPESPASNPSQTYWVSFPIQPVLMNFPVPDCPAHPSMHNGL
jgi:hypothetical protein